MRSRFNEKTPLKKIDRRQLRERPNISLCPPHVCVHTFIYICTDMFIQHTHTHHLKHFQRDSIGGSHFCEFSSLGPNYSLIVNIGGGGISSHFCQTEERNQTEKTSAFCSSELGLPSGETALLGNVSWGMGIPRMARKMPQIRNPWAETKECFWWVDRTHLMTLTWAECSWEKNPWVWHYPKKSPQKQKTKTNKHPSGVSNGASLKMQRRDQIIQKWRAAAHFFHLAWCHFLATPDQAEIWCS